MPNESHRYCCKECKRSRGQRHTPRCERLETAQRFNTRYSITMASCSRSPSPSPRAKAIARQWFDGAELLHGDGAESAPTSTSIEPDAPSTPTSRAVDAPSAELLHGYGAETPGCNRMANPPHRRCNCLHCWLADLVHVHEYGLDGCLRHKAMVRRVHIKPGYLGIMLLGETVTLVRTIMCADGGVYRNEQTGLEIITMHRVKMRTCYNYLCHTRHELNRMADAESLSTNMYDPIAC